jgi:hypothetical protein
MIVAGGAMKLLAELTEVCDRAQDPAIARGALNELSYSLLDCTLWDVPREALMRSAAMAHRHRASLGPTTGVISIAPHLESAARLTAGGVTAWPAPAGLGLY